MSDSFEEINDMDMQVHMQISRYGDFNLTNAVRPSYDLKIVPLAGYSHDGWEENGKIVPVLLASVSQENLFDTFLELIEGVGSTVDVAIKTSHDQKKGVENQEFVRESIDLVVLKSILLDFEDLLLNDGYTGIAVFNRDEKREILFDEHKMLIAFGEDLSYFEEVLAARIPCDDDMKFIMEAEHVHITYDKYRGELEVLKNRLGMDGEEND